MNKAPWMVVGDFNDHFSLLKVPNCLEKVRNPRDGTEPDASTGLWLVPQPNVSLNTKV